MSRRTAKRQRFYATGSPHDRRGPVRRIVLAVWGRERYYAPVQWVTPAEAHEMFPPHEPFYSPSIVDMLKEPA